MAEIVGSVSIPRRRSNQRVFSQENLDSRLKAGLVGHWIGVGSGNTLIDWSGYNNHGTLTNGPLWTVGREGTQHALAFDGVNDYVGLSINFPTTYPFVYAVWVKTSDTSTAKDRVLISMGDTTTNGLRSQLYMAKDPGVIGYVAWNVRNGTEAEIFSTRALNDGVWHLVIGMSVSATDHRLYVDGVLHGSSATSVTMFNSNLASSIGRRLATDADSPFPFPGLIGEARVYNRGLSQAEISLLANPSYSITLTRRRSSVSIPATATLDQEGFRFRNDDGSEAAATWLAAQDTNINRDKNLNTRLRALINAANDPTSKQFQLEYRRNGGIWRKVTT